MSDEIRKRTIRVLFNLIVLFLIITVSGLSIPSIITLFTVLLVQGISIGTLFVLILAVISLFLVIRILLDMIQIVDLASDFFIKHIPGLNDRKRISLIRALKELTLAFLLVLFGTLASPMLSLIPTVGSWVSLSFGISIFIICLFLIYDSSKTLYAMLQSWIQFFIDKISGK